jgi:hypothetical protein
VSCRQVWSIGAFDNTAVCFFKLFPQSQKAAKIVNNVLVARARQIESEWWTFFLIGPFEGKS